MKLTGLRMTKAMMGAAAFALSTGAAFSAPIVFTGYDAGAASLGAASSALLASNAFSVATSGATLVTFETPLPPSFSFSAGAITSNSTCAPALCGFNTTSGGSFFHLVAASTGVGNSVTYNFSDPVDAFGAYFSGWQVGTQTLTYTDSSVVVLDMGAADESAGGIRFFGFLDSGASISSVTYTRNGDVVSVDDVRFRATVPEPTAFALLSLALVVLGFVRRKLH